MRWFLALAGAGLMAAAVGGCEHEHHHDHDRAYGGSYYEGGVPAGGYVEPAPYYGGYNGGYRDHREHEEHEEHEGGHHDGGDHDRD